MGQDENSDRTVDRDYDTIGGKGRVPRAELESPWSFLIYVARNYFHFKPYLKGIHTLPSMHEGTSGMRRDINLPERV